MDKLQKIFGIPKATMLAPDYDAPEQDTLFITVEDSVSKAGGKTSNVTARVKGFLTVFSQAMLSEVQKSNGEADKAMRLPLGYFTKRIHQADYALTKDFFFERERDVVGSPARVQNLHERQVPFTYLYSAQYDPDRGEMTDITFTLEESLNG